MKHINTRNMKSLLTVRHLILLLLLVTLGCKGKNNKESSSEKGNARTENVAEPDGTSTFEGDKSFAYTQINEELLWEIYLKIPQVENKDYFYATKQQRLQAKSDGVFFFEPNGNRLRYDETNNDGVRNFVNIACYPTDDGEKLITIFYIGGGVDIFGVAYDKTYEYDIATGNIIEIERPVDPYTEDEFFYESIFTPEQLKILQDGFKKEWPYTYYDMNKEGYGMCFEAYGVFEKWEEYEEYCDLLFVFYKYGDNFVRREWNGKRFVKTESFPPEYLIEGKSVGRFKIGELIAFPYPQDEDVYSFERSERTEMREGTEEKIIEYTFVQYNDTMLIIKPLCDNETDSYTDKIGEITVLSEKYKTKDKIGVNAGIDDFIAIYPKHSFWWTYVSDKYVLESEHVNGNVQFVLDANDCIITPKTDSDMTILKRNDFTKDAQIKKIRVY